jgi:hypothetical protein
MDANENKASILKIAVSLLNEDKLLKCATQLKFNSSNAAGYINKQSCGKLIKKDTNLICSWKNH